MCSQQLMFHMASLILVIIGSGNGLLPDGKIIGKPQAPD